MFSLGGIVGTLLAWLGYGPRIKNYLREDWHLKIAEIRQALDRFEAWHRTWKSYKQPKVIHVRGIDEIIRSKLEKRANRWQDPTPEYLQEDQDGT